MKEPQRPLPKSILVLSALFALLELGVSLSLCFAPQLVLETVDLTARGVDYVIYMWAARQFAFGFILGFAAFKRSAPMLTLAYIFFLVMMAGDLLIGIVQKENSLIITAAVMCTVCASMIAAINRKR